MKRVVLSSFIALLIISAIAIAYFYYQQVKTPNAEALNAIPSDAAFILEVHNTKNAWSKIEGKPIWKDLVTLPFFKNISNTIHLMDSVLKAGNNEHLIASGKIFISAHMSSESSYDLLFLINLPKMQQDAFVTEIMESTLGNHYKIAKENYNGIIIHKVQMGSRNLSLAVCKGVLMTSFSSALIEDGISQLKLGRPVSNDKYFKQILAASGGKVDASLFINYKVFPKLLLSYLTSADKNPSVAAINGLNSFSNWSGMDIKINSDGLLLNGFSTASDSASFLHIFQKIPPQNMELLKILPVKTAFLLYMGIEAGKTYFQKYEQYLKVNKSLDAYRARILEINKAMDQDVQEEMSKWMGREMALVITESGGEDLKNHVYAVMESKNTNDAKLFFKKLSKGYGSKEMAAKEEVYRDCPIGFMDVPNMMPDLFGAVFGKLDKMFFTIIDDFVVVGNQASAIRRFIDDNKDKRQLIRDEKYKRQALHLEARCNLYLYVNIPRAMGLLQNLASPGLASEMDANALYFHKFTSMGLQFRSNGSLFYNKAILQEESVAKNSSHGLKPIWQTDLDTTLSAAPAIVINHKTLKTEIILQDDSNRLCLLDTAGAVLWKRALPERIIGEIHQVDALKNKRLQYLFNTSSAVYIIDRNGENIDGYPIQLKYKATNGIAIFDYDKQTDYRLFLAGDDNLIHAFQINGKPLDGWKFTEKTGLVVQPVRHYRVEDNDYLAVVDLSGNLALLDRKGKRKIEFKTPFHQVFKNPLVLMNGKDAAKAFWVSTDSSGALVKIFLDGEVVVKQLKTFSADHYFNSSDIDGDGNADYIFTDKKNLQVFHQDLTLMFTYTFKQAIESPPVLCPLADKKTGLVIVFKKASQLFLINPDGTLHNGFPVTGTTTPGCAEGPDNTSLIGVGGASKQIVLYSFQ